MKTLSIPLIENLLLQAMSEWENDNFIPIDEGQSLARPPYKGQKRRIEFRSSLDNIVNQTVEQCILAIDRDYREIRYVKIVQSKETPPETIIYNLLRKQQILDQLTGQNDIFKIVNKCSKYLIALKELKFE